MRDEHEARFGFLKRTGAEAGGQANPQVEAVAVLGLQLDDSDAGGVQQAERPLGSTLCVNLGKFGRGQHAAHATRDAISHVAPLGDHERCAGYHVMSTYPSPPCAAPLVLPSPTPAGLSGSALLPGAVPEPAVEVPVGA